MRFDGYDFILLGGVLAFGSAMLFAKAYLFPSFPEETTQTFLDANPFLVRNAIIQRSEAVAGAVWGAASLVALIVGTVRTVRGHTGHLIGSWLDVLVLLAAGLVVWRATTAISDTLSRRAYLPKMIEMQRELFEQASFVVAHEGLYRQEGKQNAVQPSGETRQKRLVDASGHLDQIGKLTDMPRLVSEADREYLGRLRPLFENHDTVE